MKILQRILFNPFRMSRISNFLSTHSLTRNGYLKTIKGRRGTKTHFQLAPSSRYLCWKGSYDKSDRQ